jgi:glutamate-1-semialdehyde 2,1-aminomutase
MRETLTKVATEEAFEKMFAGQKRLSDGLDAVLERHNIPWSVTRSGARCELQFMPTLPKNGSEAKNQDDCLAGTAASAALARIPLFVWRRVIIVHPAAHRTKVFVTEVRTIAVV